MRTSGTDTLLAGVCTVGVFALADFTAGDFFTGGREAAGFFVLAALPLNAIEVVFLVDEVVARLSSGFLAATVTAGFLAGFLAAFLTLFFLVAALAGAALRFAADCFAATNFDLAREAATPPVFAVALAAVFFTAFLTAFFATFFFTTLLAALFADFFAVFFTAVRFIATPLQPMSAPPIRTGAGPWITNPFLYPA